MYLVHYIADQLGPGKLIALFSSMTDHPWLYSEGVKVRINIFIYINYLYPKIHKVKVKIVIEFIKKKSNLIKISW